MTIRKKSKTVSLLLLQSRQVGAAQFKAHCLEIMDEVERLGIEITITKHRKPVARLVPANSKSGKLWESLYGTIAYEGDLVSPLDARWEAERDADSA